jgi:AcrR family transcriptional regulator
MTQRAGAARRPRDSAATRRALLDAARRLFAEHGYDATTVRAVADLAGVNQALLFRYFTNKRGLFEEAVQNEAVQLLSGPQEDLLVRSLDAMLSAEGERYGAESLMAVLRAATSDQVGEEVRTGLGAAYSSAFAAQAGTDDPQDAAVRGELLMAWVLGIALTRSLLSDGPLRDAEAVRRHVLRASRELLSG